MERLLKILKEFPEKKIVVVGDVMLDNYVLGCVNRTSKEAPIPIFDVEQESYFLGGAGNVAANISSLGGKVALFGFIGNDYEGKEIKKLAEETGISYYFGNCKKTILKKRLIGRNERDRQQILRMDREEKEEKIFGSQLKKKLENEIAKSNVVLISDYAKGTVTKDLMNFLQSKEKIIVDPKSKNRELYKGVLLVKTDKEEAFSMSGKNEIKSAGNSLSQYFNSNVLVTRGKEGMSLFPKNNPEQELFILTYAKKPVDVTGAGDTTLAALGLALASNASLRESALLANHAAGISVMNEGTYAVKISELEKILRGESSKRRTLEELKVVREEARKYGKKVVFTSGCYDLIHPGHVSFLTIAKSFGDVLILALNGDKSIFFKTKGEDRPILKEEERVEVLSSLEQINYIVVFDEDSPVNLIKELHPDVKVKGGSYISERVAEEDRIVKSYGGRTEYIPLIEGYSTTSIIERIKNTKNPRKT